MKRHRQFRLVQNNYKDTSLLDGLKCKYVVYGKEVAPTTGTPHLQAHVSFANAKTLTAARKELPGCDVRVADVPAASITYCKKDGDFTERGEPPQNQKDQGHHGQKYWKGILEAAEQGRLDDIPYEVRFNKFHAIEWHRLRGLQKRTLQDTEEENHWYYGPTGTGKSRKARDDYPGAYLKNCNKWWDGYEDQDTVLIEDFDKRHEVLIHHLKIWSDRYPFHAEVKGAGTGTIRPRRIIVTSNHSPEDIWTDPADVGPIRRRFKVTHFNTPQGTLKKIRAAEPDAGSFNWTQFGLKKL